MNRLDLITFLSDFGWDGGYVAACEAMLTRIQPLARISHISHEVAVGDIAAGASILERVAPLYPSAAHLAVIDPGVGTERRPLVLVTDRGDALIGPDNGLLTPAADSLGGLREAWLLDPTRVRTEAGLPAGEISSTFHGRDVFAPAAALLAGGVNPIAYGVPIDPVALVRLPRPEWRSVPEGAIAQVIEIDRFGNVELALRFDDFSPREGPLLVEI